MAHLRIPRCNRGWELPTFVWTSCIICAIRCLRWLSVQCQAHRRPGCSPAGACKQPVPGFRNQGLAYRDWGVASRDMFACWLRSLGRSQPGLPVSGRQRSTVAMHGRCAIQASGAYLSASCQQSAWGFAPPEALPAQCHASSALNRAVAVQDLAATPPSISEQCNRERILLSSRSRSCLHGFSHGRGPGGPSPCSRDTM